MASVNANNGRLTAKALAAGALVLVCGAGYAADVVVHVSGLAQPFGQVGCSLFAGAAGFPMDSTTARVQWLPADPQGVTCRFHDVGAGTYAVSIGHDVNGNQRVDTNLFGFPTEQWGVSNNVRPRLRAPHFDEAAFQVATGAGEVAIDIQVAK